MIIVAYGDSTVGIPGDYAEVDLGRDLENDTEREWVRNEMQTFFNEFWDNGKTFVHFEDEEQEEDDEEDDEDEAI